MSPSPAAVEMEIVKVTPEMAEEWLSNFNHINRKMSSATVGLYARLMEEGKWRVNGEAIMFDREGNLLNGQHRLKAIVQAGIPIETFVGRGFPPDYRDTMDQHRKRTAGDVLAMHGIQDGAHVAAVARVIYRWDQGTRSASLVGGGQSMLAPTEVLDILDKEPLILEAVGKSRTEETQQLAPSRAFSMLWVLTHRISPKEADRFFDQLVSGENLTAGNPILALRRYWTRLSTDSLTAGAGKRRRHRTGNISFIYMQAGVRAWNAWARDEEMKVVVWKENNIPEVAKAKRTNQWA